MFAGNVSLDLLDAKMKVVDIDHCIQRYEGFKRIGFTPNKGSICAEPADNARDAGPCRVCSGKSLVNHSSLPSLYHIFDGRLVVCHGRVV